jgi:3-deoxy-D-manno-octulosonic-acid transferase
LAASTHAGEDAPVIAAAQQLGQDWLTIIAPRHPDRGDAIASLAGGAPQFSRHAMPGPHDSVFVMDVLGEMASLFSLADVVFLGASLVPNGGHNPLEPAQFGRPIITGPHIFKNSAEFGGLRAAGVVFDLDYDTADTAAAALAALVMGIAADKAGLKKIHKNALDYAATAAKRADTAAAAISRLIDPPRR